MIRSVCCEEHLFALKQAVELYDTYHEKIVDCDRKIEQHLSSFEDRSDGLPLGKAHKSNRGKNKPSFDARSYLYRMTGIDLTAVDGIDTLTVLKIISEIGVDVSRWPTEKHFGSWLGLSPGSKVSGGKIISSKTKNCANRVAHALAFFRRKKAQKGLAKAITATAYKLARIIYNMLKNRTEYKDMGQDYYDKRYQNRLIENMKRRAKQFGYELKYVKEQQPVMETADS